MWWGDRVNLEVKVASSFVHQDESHEELMKRLEYSTKMMTVQGRAADVHHNRIGGGGVTAPGT